MNKKRFLLENYLQTVLYYSIITTIWFMYSYYKETFLTECKPNITFLYLFFLIPIVFIMRIIRLKLDKTILGITFQILFCITYFFILNVFFYNKQLVFISGLVVMLHSIYVTYKKSELNSYEHVNIFLLVIPIGEFIFGAWMFNRYIRELSLFLVVLMLLLQVLYGICVRKEELINNYKNDMCIPLKQISIVVKMYMTIICLAIVIISFFSWMVVGNKFDNVRRLFLSGVIVENEDEIKFYEEDNVDYKSEPDKDIGTGDVDILEETDYIVADTAGKTKNNSEKLAGAVIVVMSCLTALVVIISVIVLIINIKKYEKEYVIDDDRYQLADESNLNISEFNGSKTKKNYQKNIKNNAKGKDVLVDSEIIKKIKENVDKVLIGKSKIVDYCLVALLAEGHILLEDVPGTGKTTLAKALAKSVDVDMARIQFTTDLLPSDIVGIKYFNMARQEFELKKGPVFSNFILADEINRATPKTQSAFMECMEEQQVTIDGETIRLKTPFFVIATQNPIENYGTFPLPEAQLDRFLLKVNMEYPDYEEERRIIDIHYNSSPLSELDKVCSKNDINNMIEKCKQVEMDESLRDMIVKIVEETRKNNNIMLGASPRATLSLVRAVKAYAFVLGRNKCNIEDVREMSVPVLSHRIKLKPVNIVGNKTREQVIKEIVWSL